MISFSWQSITLKQNVTYIAIIWFMYFTVLGVPVYAIISGDGHYFNPVVLNYFMKGFLLLAYLSTAFMLFFGSSSRVVTVYLSYGTESMSESQFMEYVKTGNIRYVNDTVNTQYMHTVILNLTKEEYNLLTLRMASKELSNVKYRVDRAK